MKITLDTLRDKDACMSQGRLFARLFPEGVEVTEELCLAHFNKFDWDWCAENLLSNSALVEYRRAKASAFGKLAEKE